MRELRNRISDLQKELNEDLPVNIQALQDALQVSRASLQRSTTFSEPFVGAANGERVNIGAVRTHRKGKGEGQRGPAPDCWRVGQPPYPDVRLWQQTD